jgi:hypothetical protein
LIGISKLNQLTESGGDLTDYRSLQGSVNKYLYIKKDRLDSGITVPRQNQGLRPAAGLAWPRNKILKSK